jgi:hypothetical protein
MQGLGHAKPTSLRQVPQRPGRRTLQLSAANKSQLQNGLFLNWPVYILSTLKVDFKQRFRKKGS